MFLLPQKPFSDGKRTCFPLPMVADSGYRQKDLIKTTWKLDIRKKVEDHQKK